MKNKKNQKGFTLIELALIIAVLGILGAVGAVKLASLTTEAEKAAKDATLANARSALAIAIAKDADGKVAATEFATFLDGANAAGTEITIKGKVYTITFGGSSTDITSIVDLVPKI